MKFMMMVKHGKNPGPPPKELMDAIAILSQEAVKDGSMISPAELPSASKTFSSEAALWEYCAMIFPPASRKSSRRESLSGITSFQFSCAGLFNGTASKRQFGAFQFVSK